LDDLRTSTLSNFILEEMVTANNLATDEIDAQNLRYSRSSPRLAVASTAEDDSMIEVVPVCTIVEQFKFGDGRGQSSVDEICI
jgi:hypothetical protein